MCAEGLGCNRWVGTSGNRDSQVPFRSAWMGFTGDALAISTGSFFPKRDSPNSEGGLEAVDITSLLV